MSFYSSDSLVKLTSKYKNIISISRSKDMELFFISANGGHQFWTTSRHTAASYAEQEGAMVMDAAPLLCLMKRVTSSDIKLVDELGKTY